MPHLMGPALVHLPGQGWVEVGRDGLELAPWTRYSLRAPGTSTTFAIQTAPGWAYSLGSGPGALPMAAYYSSGLGVTSSYGPMILVDGVYVDFKREALG